MATIEPGWPYAGWMQGRGGADDPWPQPFGMWLGGEYPSRQRPRQMAGWTCGGCGSGYAPQVARCTICGPQDKADACQSPKEGGMCSCEEGDSA